MAETNQKETITEIGKLRGSRTQRAALEKLDKQESAQAVFANVERVLLWLALGELALYGLASFTLFGIARLTEEAREPEPADEFPALLELEKRAPVRRSELAPKMTTLNDIVDDTCSDRKTTQEGMRRLREALKLIAFEHPPGHFKVDLRDKYIIIRRMESNRGDEATTHSVRAKLSLLDDAMAMEPSQFRARLERFLKSNGFEI